MAKDEPAGRGESGKLRPLERRYGAMLPAAVMALVPFILSSTAWEYFSKGMGQVIGATPAALSMINYVSVAGYAFGALMGGFLVLRFPQRKLFLLLEAAFTAGAVLAATAQSTVQIGAGQVLQGLSTGLLLVVALPPVVRGFGAARMPLTAAVINLGFFGAITAGPLIGGAVAQEHAWRWYFASLAITGLIIFAAAFLSLPDQKPFDPERPFDWHAGVLGLGATVLPFYASGVLHFQGFGSYEFNVPLGLGVVCFVALILTQYHKREALSPVKPMWTTYPVIGTLIAMFGGGIFVTLLELATEFLLRVAHIKPLAAGLAFWPLLPGMIVSAVALGLVVRTRWLPILVLAGMLSLVAAAWMLTVLDTGPGSTPAANAISVIQGASVLLGIGAGATVSPGLWMAGFSLQSKMVGRIFALIELVRSVADFILAPVMLEVMQVESRKPQPTAHGVATAAWYVLLLSGAATTLCCALYLLGRPSLPPPDLARWLETSEPAFSSPPLFDLLRG